MSRIVFTSRGDTHMKPRTLTFQILPADAIAVDVAKEVLGLTEEQAGRFVYQVGLSTLYEMAEPTANWSIVRQHVQQEALNRQRGQISTTSKYDLDSGDYLDELIVLPTEKELALWPTV